MALLCFDTYPACDRFFAELWLRLKSETVLLSNLFFWPYEDTGWCNNGVFDRGRCNRVYTDNAQGKRWFLWAA